MFRQKNFFEILLSSNIHIITYFEVYILLRGLCFDSPEVGLSCKHTFWKTTSKAQSFMVVSIGVIPISLVLVDEYRRESAYLLGHCLFFHIHLHFLFLETEVWRIREKNTFQDFPIDNKVKENITSIFDGRSFGLSRLSDRETIYGWNYSKKFCCSYKVNRAATGACGNLWLVRFRWRFYKCKMKVSVFLAPLCSASEHFLNLSCIMLQNGLTHFKKLAAFTASLLKYVDLFGTLCIKGLKHYKWREKPRKYD